MDLLSADRVLLADVAWDELHQFGLAEGKTVCIDGVPYLCRLLRLRQATCKGEECVFGEWDQALDAATTLNDVWHWNKMMSWGLDTDMGHQGHRICCGYSDARHQNHGPSAAHGHVIGFRPTLIQVEPSLIPTGAIIRLDDMDFTVQQFMPDVRKDGTMFFQPVLHPMGSNGDGMVDTSIFCGIANRTRVPMYTLLMNGQPVRQDREHPQTYLRGASLSFTDHYYGREFLIPWTLANGLAYAAKPLLKGITRRELTNLGYAVAN